MGCLDRLESVKQYFGRLRPAWTRPRSPAQTRGLQIGYPENFRKLTDDAFTSSINIGTEQNSMKEKLEAHDAASSHPPSKLDRTLSKDSQHDRQSESMADTQEKGDMLPEHSTAELVDVHSQEAALGNRDHEARAALDLSASQ